MPASSLAAKNPCVVIKSPTLIDSCPTDEADQLSNRPLPMPQSYQGRLQTSEELSARLDSGCYQISSYDQIRHGRDEAILHSLELPQKLAGVEGATRMRQSPLIPVPRSFASDLRPV